jgi:GNAT superfamily N-acetyltransferase
MSTVLEVTTDAQVAACHPVMAQLRPHIPPDGFVALIRQLEAGGYRMACVIDEGEVRAVAGYRFLDQLVRGRVLYVDDLVTDELQRSRGHGDRLLAWLYDKARASGCAALELDSGTQRVDAHRFYARNRMIISAFHFVRPC